MATLTANNLKAALAQAMRSRVDAAKDKLVKEFTEEFQKELLAVAAETVIDFEEYINPLESEHHIAVTLRTRK